MGGSLASWLKKRSLRFPKLSSSKYLFHTREMCFPVNLKKLNFSSSFRVTPSSENPNGATSSVSQGKPSLRRIKGRLHRSKSLDSIDFCELTVSGLFINFFLFFKKYENFDSIIFIFIKNTTVLFVVSIFLIMKTGLSNRLPIRTLC